MQDFLQITFTWAITNGPQKLTVSPENEYNRQYHKQRVQQIRWPKYRCTIRTCYNATMLPQPKSTSEVLLQTPTFTTPEKLLPPLCFLGVAYFQSLKPGTTALQVPLVFLQPKHLHCGYPAFGNADILAAYIPDVKRNTETCDSFVWRKRKTQELHLSRCFLGWGFVDPK